MNLHVHVQVLKLHVHVHMFNESLMASIVQYRLKKIIAQKRDANTSSDLPDPPQAGFPVMTTYRCAVERGQFVCSGVATGICITCVYTCLHYMQ